MKRLKAITEVPGIKVGHASDFKALTGGTVILCEEGAIGAVDIRGTATGTRQIDALTPLHLVDKIHAILLAGGSAFGLDAAGGVMAYLEGRGKGGVGTSSIQGPKGLMVGALVVVNAFGDVLDPDSHQMLAGARKSKKSFQWANSSKWIKKGVTRKM